ncbi:MAG: serine acetyltransferase [Polyangiales bacterium]
MLRLFAAIPEIRRVLNWTRGRLRGDPAADSIEEIRNLLLPEHHGHHRLPHRARAVTEARVPMIPRILAEWAHGKTGIDIHPAAVIGERFFVDHGTGVVVGATAVIGHNVKLYQGVTLGALSVPRRGETRKRHPTLEDDVTVYAHATILGGDTVIGQGSVIGGNACGSCRACRRASSPRRFGALAATANGFVASHPTSGPAPTHAPRARLGP